MRSTPNVLIFLIWQALLATAQAQQDGVLPIGDPLHQFLIEQHTFGNLPEAHLGSLPLSVYEARQYLDSLDRQRDLLSRTDQVYLDRFLGVVSSPGADFLQGIIPQIYQSGRDFFAVAGESYGLQINPLLYLAYGRAQGTRRDDGLAMPSLRQNTRGIRISGHLGNHLFFESRLEETQRREVWPAYDPKWTAPRLAFVRLNRPAQEYDYQTATGLLGIKTKHVELRFGRDRNRWGYGVGSLALSNYAPAYDQLQIRTSFWRIQYTNLFALLSDLTSFPPGAVDRTISRKFSAFHRLEVQLPLRIQLELFEGVIVMPDTNRNRARFDLGYLNPVILYRAVEADRGSPDNVLLGGGISWIVHPGWRFYSHILLDELVVGQIGNGWWGNKWAVLAGLHVVDHPFPNTSLRVEYARLRPYLYSHVTAHNAYVHHNDILGHPAGPNAEDIMLELTARPTLRTQVAVTAAFTFRGRNTENLNYGSDPLISYVSRVSENNVWLRQGISQSRMLLEAHAGIEALPNLFLNLALRSEIVDDNLYGRSYYTVPYLMLQWGIPYQSLRY
jgi:hypothetical protein